VSLVRDLAERHRSRLLRFDARDGVDFDVTSPGMVGGVRLTDDAMNEAVELRPRWVLLAAGEGNARLRERVGLSPEAMQRRPLHMVLVRGDLPELFGHCVDGAKTRVTITSAKDPKSRSIWQVGGQVSEDGVAMSPDELMAHARSELAAVLPAWTSSGHEWATYRIDRAEGRTATGMRPEGPRVLRDGNVITAWPTKLALVPELAKMVRREIGEPAAIGGFERPAQWPQPEIAPPPWEGQDRWVTLA